MNSLNLRIKNESDLCEQEAQILMRPCNCRPSWESMPLAHRLTSECSCVVIDWHKTHWNRPRQIASTVHHSFRITVNCPEHQGKISLIFTYWVLLKRQFFGHQTCMTTTRHKHKIHNQERGKNETHPLINIQKIKQPKEFTGQTDSVLTAYWQTRLNWP